MSSVPIIDTPVRPGRSGMAARLSILFGGVLLSLMAVRFLAITVAAFRSPYQRDYGEGIVWQQMRLMFEGKGYAPIDGFPAIVFHYPPFYHATVEALTLATGFDPLMLGRLVSFVATLASAFLVALIGSRIGRPAENRLVAVIGGSFAALAALNLPLVQIWALVMRVDMMAIALSLAGIWFGMRAIVRPGAIYGAALCFVAAVFTKQTAIAAPFAVFAVLLLVRPRTAGRGIAAATALGSLVLVALVLATHGGILRHLILYNINRLSPSGLSLIPVLLMNQLLFFAAVAIGLVHVAKDRLPAYRKLSAAEVRRKLADSPDEATLLIAVLYFATKTLMAGLVAKSGANANYFIEWLLAGAIFIGPAVREVAAEALGERRETSPPLTQTVLPAALGVPALAILMSAAVTDTGTAERHRGIEPLRQLSAMVQAAPGPVISDDMVILLRNGKEVLWEPAIFAELASTGHWDERPFIELIRARHFSFFITEGGRGDRIFDSRYTPPVASAMDEAYPTRCWVAGYLIHLPASAARPSRPGPCRQLKL